MGAVALTFDDGPSAYTDDLLDLLDEYGAKVTFFISKLNVPIMVVASR
jgi:peptidoglycan/xylan/chitin deacetylase (PgdA/CDA1 family)